MIVTKFIESGVIPNRIGIITPYEDQKFYIINYMQSNGSLRKDLYKDIKMGSVNTFQG